MIELTVELNREDLARYVQLAEDSFGQQLTLDGFRTGKAPREAVRKHVGEARILETALETAVQRSLGQVINEQELDVIEAKNLSVKDNSAEKLLYTVELQVFPEVALAALDEIKVTNHEVSVEPKELDEALETLRASRAVLSDKDEPAEMGDRLEVDFTVSQNGALIKDGESKNHPIMLGKGHFVPGFEEQLVGTKKGDHKEFSLTAPADFANKDIAGKKLEFAVTVNDVKKVTLPELTDEFAKSLGKFENMDQLILNVKDGLLEENKNKENQRARTEIVNALIAKSPVTAPVAMVESQLGTMIRNFDQDLHRHNMELSLYLANINKTQDDLKKEWRAEAERQVKIALILHAVARKHDISVSPEEATEALDALMQSAMLQGDAKPDLDMERMRGSIQARLLNEKVFEFLEKKCVSVAS